MKTFEYNGIVYYCDDCSVGFAGNGPSTAQRSIIRIKERNLKNLHIIDLCCGVGVIGLTLLKELGSKVIKTLMFSDINIFNLNSIRRTIKKNEIDDSNIYLRLSDGLKNISPYTPFDLIISNPPHCFTRDFTELDFSPSWLGSCDEGWSFHARFYDTCHNFLSSMGETWFLENKSTEVEKVITPVIKRNVNLNLYLLEDEPLDPEFFWMLTRKISSSNLARID